MTCCGFHLTTFDKRLHLQDKGTDSRPTGKAVQNVSDWLEGFNIIKSRQCAVHFLDKMLLFVSV
jgi:hypothetical protein